MTLELAVIQEQIRSRIDAVIADRALAAELKSRLDEKKKAYEESVAELTDEYREAKAFLSASEEALCELARQVYAENGEKKPFKGVEIKVFETFDIADYQGALAWAKRHDLALELDVEMFKRLFAVVGDPSMASLVSFRTEEKVYLSKAL